MCAACMRESQEKGREGQEGRKERETKEKERATVPGGWADGGGGDDLGGGIGAVSVGEVAGQDVSSGWSETRPWCRSEERDSTMIDDRHALLAQSKTVRDVWFEHS